MLVVIEKKDGKFNELLKQLKELEDGRYLITVRSLGFKTIRSYQNSYFAMIDSVRDTTGDTKQEIHELMKHENNVETTRDFNEEDWIKYLEAMRWYYFQKADILL